MTVAKAVGSRFYRYKYFSVFRSFATVTADFFGWFSGNNGIWGRDYTYILTASPSALAGANTMDLYAAQVRPATIQQAKASGYILRCLFP
jgi:hypothetical protein